MIEEKIPPKLIVSKYIHAFGNDGFSHIGAKFFGVGFRSKKFRLKYRLFVDGKLTVPTIFYNKEKDCYDCHMWLLGNYT